MSGDHSATTNYKKEVLTNSGFIQFDRTTLFKKNGVFLLSPSVSKNQNGGYWFDIREAITTYVAVAKKAEATFLFVRIVPNRFVVASFVELENVMKTHSKLEENGAKVWSFEVTNRFSMISNRSASGEKIPARSLTEEEAVEFLNSI